MVHIVAAPPEQIRAFEACPVFFNIEGAVGPGRTASLVNTQLVMFFLKKIGERPQNAPEAAALARIDLSKPTDPANLAMIRVFQDIVRNRSGTGVTADGVISSAQGFRFGNNTYSIVHLNAAFRRRYPQDFLYFERLQGCPGELRTEAMRIK